MKLVLATANPDKAAEIRAVLLDAGVAVELVPRPDDVPEVEEDGATLEDNARLKAVVLCAAAGFYAYLQPNIYRSQVLIAILDPLDGAS